MQRVIIFDLAEVLIEGLSSLRLPLAEQLNIPPDTVIPGLGGEPLVALMEGKICEETYWQRVLERTRWTITEVELGLLARHAFCRTIPGMPELLASLRAHRLVLLSDHAREWMAYIDAMHPFLQGFERRFISYEIGQTKRQIETFRRVLTALGCTPHDCVFIDDLQWNVDRAVALGIQAHTFTSAEALQRFLNAEGLA
jgi:HAD superfamily hydrolase (TIGR01509 family)